jgi:peptide chain release factor 1
VKTKTKLFSVTAADCRWIAKRGSGKGGQKRNKTSNAIQCFHDPSGAQGEAEDLRDQSLNRRKAFERMVESKEFQSWLTLKIEAAKGKVEIEYKDDRGFLVKRPLEAHEV